MPAPHIFLRNSFKTLFKYMGFIFSMTPIVCFWSSVLLMTKNVPLLAILENPWSVLIFALAATALVTSAMGVVVELIFLMRKKTQQPQQDGGVPLMIYCVLLLIVAYYLYFINPQSISGLATYLPQ